MHNLLPNVLPVYQFITETNFFEELEKSSIIKQIGSSLQDKPLCSTTYLNPLIIIHKGNSIKCVLDACHLISNAEQSD